MNCKNTILLIFFCLIITLYKFTSIIFYCSYVKLLDFFELLDEAVYRVVHGCYLLKRALFPIIVVKIMASFLR